MPPPSAAVHGADSAARNATLQGCQLTCQQLCASIDHSSAVSHVRQFEHPMSPPVPQLGAQQAHADMSCWLAHFFNGSASRLTSSRLQAAAAAEAADTSGALEEALEEQAEAAEPEEISEVQVPAGAPGCDSDCVRAAAQEVMLEVGRVGGGAPRLRWPPFSEDARRWAPTGTTARGFRMRSPDPGHDTCVLRRPGEHIAKDFLVIAAVGNDWGTIDG